MNSFTTPFSKMALALLLSVSGMLLSLSALAIATDDINHERTSIEVTVDVKDQSTRTL